MTSVADTSWLYAIFNRTDPHHERAFGEAAKADEIFVPPVILAELAGLLRIRLKQNRDREAIEALDAKPNFRIAQPDHDHDATMDEWRRAPRLSYADSAAVAAARRLKADLASFDKGQVRALSRT